VSLNDVNSHPHLSQDGNLAIIRERDHRKLRYAEEGRRPKRGHEFESDTDTEILVHLIKRK
jgi:glucosamine--fructose-6-phosphate aminotransferase (isomerizing)